MAGQHRETFEPVTLGHIRSHGCRDLLVYCGSINCDHSVTRMRTTCRTKPLSVRSDCAWSAHGAVMSAPMFARIGDRTLTSGTSR
jgi:hypothetical protein